MRQYVETVCGPIRIDDIGITLTHEHLWVDGMNVYSISYGAEKMSNEKISIENRKEVLKDLSSVVFGYKDNVILADVEESVRELEDYKAAGGGTLFEVSTIDLGRNPVRLREISQKSGVHIIMGGTYYYYPSIDAKTKEIIQTKGKNGLADLMIREFYDGVGDTGIRPGVLGEVGLQHKETDLILAHAAMIAQRETGAPVIFHCAPEWILDVAEAEGADLQKVVMGHWSMSDPVEKALQRGAWVSFDQFGMNFPGIINDDQRIDDVMAMFENGWEKQLLISQDVAWKTRLKKYGGNGYAELLKDTVPRLYSRGLSREQVTDLLVENPKKLLR